MDFLVALDQSRWELDCIAMRCLGKVLVSRSALALRCYSCWSDRRGFGDSEDGHIRWRIGCMRSDAQRHASQLRRGKVSSRDWVK